MTDTTIGGRPARVTGIGHVRPRGFRAYSMVQIKFLDTGETLTMPSGKFAKWSTNWIEKRESQ